jgi:hypothetical protein
MNYSTPTVYSVTHIFEWQKRGSVNEIIIKKIYFSFARAAKQSKEYSSMVRVPAAGVFTYYGEKHFVHFLILDLKADKKNGQ